MSRPAQPPCAALCSACSAAWPALAACPAPAQRLSNAYPARAQRSGRRPSLAPAVASACRRGRRELRALGGCSVTLRQPFPSQIARADHAITAPMASSDRARSLRSSSSNRSSSSLRSSTSIRSSSLNFQAQAAAAYPPNGQLNLFRHQEHLWISKMRQDDPSGISSGAALQMLGLNTAGFDLVQTTTPVTSAAAPSTRSAPRSRAPSRRAAAAPLNLCKVPTTQDLNSCSVVRVGLGHKCRMDCECQRRRAHVLLLVRAWHDGSLGFRHRVARKWPASGPQVARKWPASGPKWLALSGDVEYSVVLIVSHRSVWLVVCAPPIGPGDVP